MNKLEDERTKLIERLKDLSHEKDELEHCLRSEKKEIQMMLEDKLSEVSQKEKKIEDISVSYYIM